MYCTMYIACLYAVDPEYLTVLCTLYSGILALAKPSHKHRTMVCKDTVNGDGFSTNKKNIPIKTDKELPSIYDMPELKATQNESWKGR